MKMRNKMLIGALLLVLPGVAQAQQTQQQTQQPPAPAAATEKTPAASDSGATTFRANRIDFGFRADSISGDPARFQRFRDLRNGAYLPMFRFEQESTTSIFRAEANNVGYRDQRFAADYENIGKLKVNFEWNQTPLYISSDVRTLYTDQGNGVLSIDQGLRQSIQNAGLSNSAAAYSALSNGIRSLGDQMDLRSRRDVGRFSLTYSLNRDIDFKVNVRNTNRSGHNLMAFGFGTSPGLNPAVEVPVPTDDRTTDVGAMMEFANTRGLFSIGFTGSKYNNNIPVVQFDNPLRATDAVGGSNVGGPAFGRVPMWPTNSAVALNLNGSYKLPARSRASAFISVGRWNQNEALVEPTSNTALVAPPLERASAEAKADITSMVYTFTSRPAENVWLNARYRYYDYASKTEPFEMPALPGDWNLTGATWENESPSIKRNTLDVDTSFTPYKYVAFGLGLTREDADRTFRYFEKTAENSFRATVDSTGNQYFTVRGKFEHSRRTGSGFDEEHLTEGGEHAEARQFDIADRDRDRGTVILTVTPAAQFDVNASVSAGKDNYRNTGFGLRDNKNNGWSVGFDLVPVQTVNFGVNYGFEKYTALQWSRTANPAPSPGFFDPTRDWGIDSGDQVKTFSASLDLVKALPKTDVRLSYNLSDGKATYVYKLTPNSTILSGITYGPGNVYAPIPVVQLPQLKNKLADTRVDLTHYVRQNVALGIGYWYESYKVDDFALNPSTTGTIVPVNGSSGVFASTIYSGYMYRPYTAHTGWLHVTYLW
jgi:MtrB/PioB family decaheme-associated outer membrane protein